MTHSTYALDASKSCLVHACAGGTGQLVTQMAKILGAKVIGTCSTAKMPIADSLTNGSCDHIIDYKQDNVEERVKELTKNKGVDVKAFIHFYLNFKSL